MQGNSSFCEHQFVPIPGDGPWFQGLGWWRWGTLWKCAVVVLEGICSGVSVAGSPWCCCWTSHGSPPLVPVKPTCGSWLWWRSGQPLLQGQAREGFWRQGWGVRERVGHEEPVVKLLHILLIGWWWDSEELTSPTWFQRVWGQLACGQPVSS